MDTTSLAHQSRGHSREQRALELYRKHGSEIRHVGEDMYYVPSCTGRGFYSVDYREETCDCPDFLYRHENCKHILAVGVHVAKRRKREISRAGDPFFAAAENRPCACNDGWVSMEVEVVDPSPGEETVEEALYLCRRCAGEDH